MGHQNNDKKFELEMELFLNLGPPEILNLGPPERQCVFAFVFAFVFVYVFLFVFVIVFVSVFAFLLARSCFIFSSLGSNVSKVISFKDCSWGTPTATIIKCPISQYVTMGTSRFICMGEKQIFNQPDM